MKYPDCVWFIGIKVDENVLQYIWKSDDEEEYVIDFNNLKSFDCLLNIIGEYNKKEVKELFNDETAKKNIFWELARDWLESNLEIPGGIHYSFEATNDNILVDITGH